MIELLLAIFYVQTNKQFLFIYGLLTQGNACAVKYVRKQA